MADWRVKEESADFHDILYDEEEQRNDDEKISSDEMEFVDTKIEIHEHELHYPSSPGQRIPQHSSLPSPKRWKSSPREEKDALHSGSRDRSRSPIGHNFSSESAPLEVVIRVVPENNMPTEAVDADNAASFLVPDTHARHVAPEDPDRSARNKRKISGRRGIRGVRGRATIGYSNLGCRGNTTGKSMGNKEKVWKKGHPLNEIWTSDDDVPIELVRMATDVMRKRQIRLQDAARAQVGGAKRDGANESEDEDEFFEASDGADGITRLEGENLLFDWSPRYENFKGQEETFKPKRTGSVRCYNSAYDAFRSYWSDDVLDHIVSEINLYATTNKTATFRSLWYNTNMHEILCLFSFWMMLGIIKMPTTVSCFSVDPLLKTDVFRRIFTRKRYVMLTRAFNFIQPTINVRKPATDIDRLHRLRPIITHLNLRFQSNYILDKDICINDTLNLWNKKINYKQNIRGKAAKFGIKSFELCESSTGYLWSFMLYSGSSNDLERPSGVLRSTIVVKKLIRPLLKQGYRLFMDNWYNSPLLARFLKLHGTDFVGTLRPSRSDIPIVIEMAPLKMGQFIARHSGDLSLLSWQDKKRITMISTCHNSSTALPTVQSRPTSRPIPFKPQVVLDYNKFMRSDDFKEQMLDPYLLERKGCINWYMTLFKRLLTVSILNSRTLLESSTKKNQEHLAFRLELVDSILRNHLSHCPQNRKYTVSSSKSAHELPGRYINSKHWPVLLEPSELDAARKRQSWKRCFICLRKGKKSQRSRFCCEYCRVPLCIQDCFKEFHTSP